MNKSIFASFIVLALFFELVAPYSANAKLKALPAVEIEVNLLSNGPKGICKLDKEDYEIVKKVRMIITAYNSVPEQTDDTPFITASGKRVADGIIANNLLPFGTKVRMPQLFGGKIFIVEDRMHSRKGKYMADIWMPEYEQAKQFGAKLTEIEVLEN